MRRMKPITWPRTCTSPPTFVSVIGGSGSPSAHGIGQTGDTLHWLPTFRDDLRSRRMDAAAELLARQAIPVSDVARLVGYRQAPLPCAGIPSLLRSFPFCVSRQAAPGGTKASPNACRRRPRGAAVAEAKARRPCLKIVVSPVQVPAWVPAVVCAAWSDADLRRGTHGALKPRNAPAFPSANSLSMSKSNACSATSFFNRWFSLSSVFPPYCARESSRPPAPACAYVAA